MIQGFFNKLFKSEPDSDVLSPLDSALFQGPHPNSHLILWTTVVFVVIALIWANYASLEEVTRGQGKIIPSSHVQVIQNLEGGILSEILVHEGQLVEPGQVLVRLDDIRFSSSFKESHLKKFELIAQIARLTAEADGTEFKVPEEVTEKHPILADTEKRLYRSRQNELKASIFILEEKVRQEQQELKGLNAKQGQQSRSYQLLSQEVQMSAPLVEQGALSQVELLRLKRDLSDLKGELDSTRHSIPRVKSELQEARKKITELELRFKKEALAELNEARAELARLSETMTAQKDRVTRTLVKSPVKGTVNQLKVTTIGGVIQPGMDLLEIVPIEDQLLIEAKIRPADIAFLHPGQKAMVKLTAYDFSIYGGLKGILEHISADTILDEDDESYYLIRIRTDKNYLGTKNNPLDIISGMTVDVDILTGKKTVLDYLLKPVLKAKQLAMRER